MDTFAETASAVRSLTGSQRILVVEDDPVIREMVVRGIVGAGYIEQHTDNGTEALALASEQRFDAAIVDLMLPDIDGLDVIHELRRRGNTMGVIILSARRSVGQRVAGLRIGADDYVAKPFDMIELLARLEAVVRRTSSEPDSRACEAYGVVLDAARREVRRDGQRIDLTAREFKLLMTLMQNRGTPLSKAYLQSCLWGPEFDPSANVVDVLVCRLRSKLDKGRPTTLIHTIRGMGYVFREQAATA